MNKNETKASRVVSFWHAPNHRKLALNRLGHVTWLYLGPLCIRIRH